MGLYSAKLLAQIAYTGYPYMETRNLELIGNDYQILFGDGQMVKGETSVHGYKASDRE